MTAGRRRLVDPSDGRKRCAWAATDALLATYHDEEWGKAIRTDPGHLERMALEIFQCGLSWRMVLTKRTALRKAFGGFSVAHAASFTKRDIDRLMQDATIIRNRRKIEAVVYDARRFLELADAHGSYRRWLDGLKTETPSEVASASQVFAKLFRFMGPETTRCYLMGIGKIAPDHDVGCWRADCA